MPRSGTLNSDRRPSIRRDFSQSENPVHNSVIQRPAGPDATYDRDDIFIGWKRATSDHYKTLKNAKWKEFKELSSEVYREALFMFKNRFSDKDIPDMSEMFIDQSSAAVTFRAGERGAGKSFCLRAEGNRSAKSGILTIHIDPAHEYYTNNKESGIQNEILRQSAGLRQGETPQPIETKVLMPSFIKKARRQSNLGMPGSTWTTEIQFSFDDLDPQDISYMFMKDVNKSQNESRYKDFRKFVGELNQKIENGEVTDFDDVEDLSRRMQEAGRFSYSERDREIQDVIEPYKRWNFLGDKHSLYDKQEDIPDDEDQNQLTWYDIVQNVPSIALSLEDDDNCPDDLEMMQFYIAQLVKKVRSLRKQGVFDRPTNWIIDEIHRFVDSEDHDQREKCPPAHWEIRKIIKEDRKIGFRVSMASQQVKDIPEDNFLKQTDHMFIPMNMDKDDRRYLLQLYDIYSQGDDSRDKWKSVFETMGEYEWFYMRKKTKSWSLVVPASPIGNHLRE